MLPSPRRDLVPDTEPGRSDSRPQPAAPARRGRGWAWIVAGLTVALAVAGAALYSRQPAARTASTPVPVRTAKVRRIALDRTLRVSGITAAENYSALMAPHMPGSRIGGHGDFRLELEKLVKPGSHVKKGEVVAEFDRQHMLIRLDDFRANTLQHELNILRMNSQLEVRRKSYVQRIDAARGRMEKAELDLKKTPILSEIRSERLRLLYHEARDRYQELLEEARYMDISELASIRWSELDLRQTKLEQGRAEANVNRMLVRAPIDGLAVVLNVHRAGEQTEIRVGDQLQPGQPFMQVVDLNSMVVNASVNQVDAEQLRPATSARVRFDAYPGLELPARLLVVAAMARQGGWRAAHVRQVPIRLKLEDHDPRVVPNLSASVDLILETAPEDEVVPIESVFHDESGKPVAYVQSATGWEKRELELGLANHVAVRVLAGLQEGETVALEPPPR